MIDRLDTPHGTLLLLAVHDVDAATAALHADEQAVARSLGEIRRRDFVTGRTALHRAIADGFAWPILADDRGAPVMPAGWAGSVSHKGPLAAALVAPSAIGWIGVDLERAEPPRGDIARRILTDRERSALSEGDVRGRAVTLRFSIKEAIYKAIDPTLRRYVGFTEVELELAGAHCRVITELPFTIDVSWREHAGYWVTTARALPR